MTENPKALSRFYEAFEEKFRGPRALVLERLAVYLPFILPLKSLDAPPSSLDLGCGRGEWLEFLLEHGFHPRGVDLDEGMLEKARILHLPAEKGDAIQTLLATPDESLVLVTGFHIAEHLPFASLQTLVREALRVLKPGGLLILETPNPDNLRVAAQDFYLDPTHLRPLPSALLAFLAEFSGFHRHKILGLYATEDPDVEKHPLLVHCLHNASPDYALVAQKNAVNVILKQFDAAFARNYGLPLNTLVQNFDKRVLDITDLAQEARRESREAERRAEEADKRASEAEKQAGQALLVAEEIARRSEAALRESEIRAEATEKRLQEVTAEALAATAEADKATRRAEEALLQAQKALRCATEADERTKAALWRAEEAGNRAAEALHQAVRGWEHHALIRNSTSWKITAPLRLCVDAWRWFRVGVVAWLTWKPGSRPRRIAEGLFSRSVARIRTSPRLKRLALALLWPLPGLRTKLLATARNLSATAPPQTAPPAPPPGVLLLSPRAEAIHQQLIRAMEKSRRGMP